MYYILFGLLSLTFFRSIPQTNGAPALKNQISRFPIRFFRGISDVDVPQKYLLNKKVCKVVFKSLPKLSLSNMEYSRSFRKTKVKCHWIKKILKLLNQNPSHLQKPQNNLVQLYKLLYQQDRIRICISIFFEFNKCLHL